MKKSTLSFVILLLITSFMGPRQYARAGGSTPSNLAARQNKIDPTLQETLSALPPGGMLTVIVTLRDQEDAGRLPGAGEAAHQEGVIRALQARAAASQWPIRALLAARGAQSKVSRVIPFWVLNGLSVTATADVIEELAARADVRAITPDAIQIVPVSEPADNLPEANLSVIQAPSLWDLGYSGQGVVVASMDSGVDLNHPDLYTRWRGGTNSWYDPFNQHPVTPTDLSGHGTWTMGVMVAGDAGGTSIGVAPGAQWIAVKIFNDSGSSTATAIHQGFQWLLDPDGNPGTADAPQVVNNSWAFGIPGCNLEFQLDLQALVAAGILPVFAAGNYGPGGSTSVSPANYPEAFAVGATNNSDQIYAYSSRGPSACGEPQTIYPEIVAPGVNINTTDLFGFYYRASGTSLSAPHASGALGLLLSAFPNLTVSQLEAALVNTAVDLGAPGPDNKFGYGRLDVLAAYQWLAASGGDATPTPTATNPPLPTATNTPLPIPTATSTPSPTPTATPPGGGTMHVGDLDGVSNPNGRNLWDATVTIYVHDANHQPVSAATVNGAWSNGGSGSGSCLTNAAGSCSLTIAGLPKKSKSVAFTINSISHATLVYQPGANHDPDGDSNGTTITILNP